MNFDDIFVFTIGRERGLVDNEKDPGGRTNFGVTQHRLNIERDRHPEWNLPVLVDDLTPLQVKMIYRAGEWTDIHGDDLPGAIALLAFEAAVNQSSRHAVDELQAALRIPRDGIMGPITLQAVRAADTRSLCEEYAAQRAYYYAKLDNLDDEFGLGWMRRLFRCYTVAIGGKS